MLNVEIKGPCQSRSWSALARICGGLLDWNWFGEDPFVAGNIFGTGVTCETTWVLANERAFRHFCPWVSNRCPSQSLRTRPRLTSFPWQKFEKMEPAALDECDSVYQVSWASPRFQALEKSDHREYDTESSLWLDWFWCFCGCWRKPLASSTHMGLVMKNPWCETHFFYALSLTTTHLPRFILTTCFSWWVEACAFEPPRMLWTRVLKPSKTGMCILSSPCQDCFVYTVWIDVKRPKLHVDLFRPNSGNGMGEGSVLDWMLFNRL